MSGILFFGDSVQHIRWKIEAGKGKGKERKSIYIAPFRTKVQEGGEHLEIQDSQHSLILK